ncbi:hypothetical protein MK489_13540 [Myxococcota bacterium]|nr:hypothetical protein [Myxococcota bacterium]
MLRIEGDASWDGCRVRVLADDGRSVFEDEECDVRVRDGGLEVVYWDDRGAVYFSGRREPDGDFDLWCRSRPRRAVLTFESEARRFTGTWREGDDQGTWVVELPDAVD